MRPPCRTAWSREYHGRRRDPRGMRCNDPQNFSNVRVLARGILRLVLDVGLGTIAAGCGFGVPLAVGRLVFDGFSTPGHALLGGGPLCSRKRGGMARKGFRECAFDGISPAAIMLDDFVGDMGHRGTRWFWRRGERGMHFNAK